MITLSVIVPSRLARAPMNGGSDRWLDRALQSIRTQQGIDLSTLEVVVGIDAGMLGAALASLRDERPGAMQVRFVEARGRGQAHAVNAAVDAAQGGVLAILEDDDQWKPQRLASGLKMLDRYELVTCNSREVESGPDRAGAFVRIFDFPTPSSWMMRRALWDEIGPLDVSFRWHVDTEWLGRLNGARKKRVHQVDADGAARIRSADSWLAQVSRWSAVAVMPDVDPLVDRYVHADSGVGQIESSADALAVSVQERERIVSAFGCVPW